MSPNYPSPLSQDPSQASQPLPSKSADEPTLEEVAARIKAANTPPADATASAPTPPPTLTSSEEIPSSAPSPAGPPPPATETPDAISQLDALPATPNPQTSPKPDLARQIAENLAQQEVIGEHQIDDVTQALNPETLQAIAKGENQTDTVPISVTNSDGTNLLIQVPTKSIFDFLSGRTDLVSISK